MKFIIIIIIITWDRTLDLHKRRPCHN